jgi:molybdate transport system ATP-binding protein
MKVSLQHRLGDFDLDLEFQTYAPVTGVYGPSGAGKTTLLNLIAGLDHPRPPGRGRIELDGSVFLDTDRGICIPPEHRRVGIVFQEHRLFPHYTVAGNLDYGASRLPGTERSPRRSAIVDMLELGPLLNRSVQSLSGGERQRVALGRALLAAPRVLLLDEPLSSLDTRLHEQVIPYLRRVRDEAGVPMLYVSHDLPEIQRLTDRLLLIQRGRITGHGLIRDLAHDLAAASVLRSGGMVNSFSLCLAGSESADGLTALALRHNAPPAVLRIPSEDVPQGAGPSTLVDVSIRPEDVAMSLHAVPESSFQNQLPAVVTRLSIFHDRAMVEVDAGVPILALLSKRSVEQLQLRPGSHVHCLIKSLAVRSARERGSLQDGQMSPESPVTP